MKKFLLPLVFLTSISVASYAQSGPKIRKQANWQQKADYTIQVTLNDENRTLTAYESIEYTNNSPNVLHEIYMHLWPNAYKNRNTAYARQELENGNTNFYYAEPSSRGWIDSIDFQVNGKKVTWGLEKDIDIAKITLNEPLNPGQKITITTPFRVVIPDVFSRMGYEDGIYCITQWYPKPAVYDVNGWNPIPYLNQGEFYSEFGKFDVSITVQKDYVLAATGEVQDANEKNWWLERSKSAKAPHFAKSEMKTLRFIQDSVHDFAWFCSKKFMTDRSEVKLSDGRTVETWIFAKSQNGSTKPNGIEFVNRGISFYSEKVGNYPYSIAQVVITPLKAGGGMEYPTITNCAGIDKTTIVHEVGHNWFYGILGSNERDYPWMDESFNTYYEGRSGDEDAAAKEINETGKKPEAGDNLKLSTIGKVFGLIDQSSILFQYTSRKNNDQPGNLHSAEYTDNNYGAIIYAKNPLAFGYLQAYLGTAQFDVMMHAYYEKWKFKHPLPDDFRQHAESFTGKNLSWFFDDVLGSDKKEDYKLCSVKNGMLTLSNKGKLVAPVSISQIVDNKVVTTTWIEGFDGTKKLSLADLKFQEPASAKSVIYRIDAEKKTIDLYRQNNTIMVKGTGKDFKQVKFQPLLNLESDHSEQIFWAPVFAHNLYNRNMFGLAFYNSLFPQKKTEFAIMPVYSFYTKDVNGYASLWHNFNCSGKIKTITAGIKSARFGSEGVIYRSKDPVIQSYLASAGSYYTNIAYEKISPFIEFQLQPTNRRSNISQKIEARYVMVNEQQIANGYFANFGKDHYGIGNISYLYKRADALYPSNFGIDFQSGLHQTNFNRLSGEFKQSFAMKGGKKMVSIRIFGGLMLSRNTIKNIGNTVYERSMFQAGGTLGANDYLYDESMMGRMDNGNGFWAHQVLQRDAGFRNFVNLGSSDKWLTACNLTIPAPFKLPVGIYADITYSRIAPFESAKMYYIGGVYLQIVKDIAYWYFPVTQSKEINDVWDLNGYSKYLSRTSFVFNLSKVNPINLIRNIKF